MYMQVLETDVATGRYMPYMTGTIAHTHVASSSLHIISCAVSQHLYSLLMSCAALHSAAEPHQHPSPLLESVCFDLVCVTSSHVFIALANCLIPSVLIPALQTQGWA